MKRREVLKHMTLMAGSIALTQSISYASNMKKAPVIVIHGGTSGLGLSNEEFQKRKAVMIDSLKAGQQILERRGEAIDAVIAAIKVMEDSPIFNAGRGAVFNSDGYNELDAAIMHGQDRRAGAIAMSKHIKNPIEAARIVMEKTPHTLIAGDGADRLASKYGLQMVPQKYFFTQERWNQLLDAKAEESTMLDSDGKRAYLGEYTEPYLGTVGAVAYDYKGNIVAGTSTGGLTNKMAGRIGDSPIIGAGTYADNESLGLSCTGTGDIFIRVASGHEASALYKYKNYSLQQALESTLKQISAIGGTGGIVSIDKDGNTGFAWTKDELGMFHGEARVGEDIKVFFPVAKS